MADSFMGAAAVLLLAGVVLFFINPIIAILPLLLLVALVGLKAAGVLFKHAAPTADAGNGPAVPSSGDAAYDPVANPADRAV